MVSVRKTTQRKKTIGHKKNDDAAITGSTLDR
jgi:hypothetical protein